MTTTNVHLWFARLEYSGEIGSFSLLYTMCAEVVTYSLKIDVWSVIDLCNGVEGVLDDSQMAQSLCYCWELGEEESTQYEHGYVCDHCQHEPLAYVHEHSSKEHP